LSYLITMPIDIRAFSHVVLPVSDLDASLAFFHGALGLEIVMEIGPDDPDAEGGIASGLRIAGVAVPGGMVIELVQGMTTKLESAAVLALNVADIRAAAKQAEDAGLTPTMPPTEVMPGVTMMFLADPDGRTIELVEFGSGARSSFENLQADAQAP
jgi:catechol 2,3-dioxygenase-like lactoylglutathione lyase family enzyme